MKYKITLALLAPLIVIALMGAAAPSTVTDTNTRFADGWNVTKISWVADSTGAVVADTSVIYFRGIIHWIATNPDTSRYPATADSSGRGPTDNYDITLTNNLGIDVAGGALMNRDTANTERVSPWLITPVDGDADTLPVPFFNDSKLITAITNNKINNARGDIYIYWEGK